ncbi:hemolysin activation secretion protein [Leptolyngbya sp. Heron Island J]|uniref:ShlB/FhaC/HecB family hemolysin secretion/activation protein n=1 Tax=Leptolyngbya sp. Heron Island J TaxID=1385935 RepID=UPI0003B95958|nr:ShlB/FhaC/HecB family hemolysin secretion/activation protein [Leptolyngbya sp. Heron Island J]ESA33820.1 hemolysin activation secretion protein [Leptolyngbya sp. Heron Island J]
MSKSISISSSKQSWVRCPFFLRPTLVLAASLKIIIVIGSFIGVQAGTNSVEDKLVIQADTDFSLLSEHLVAVGSSLVESNEDTSVLADAILEVDASNYIDETIPFVNEPNSNVILLSVDDFDESGSEDDLEDYLILEYRVENCCSDEEQISETLADRDIEFRAEIDAIVIPYLGQTVSSAIRKGIQDAVTLQYLNRGYVTSRAQPLRVEGNTLIIPVLEGYIQDIRVRSQDSSEFPEDESYKERTNLGRYVRALLRNTTGDVGQEGTPIRPINLSKLEDHVRLMSLDPRFENKSVVATLQATDTADQAASILEIELREINWDAKIDVNNDSPPSLGETGIDWETNYNLGDGSRFTLEGRYIPAGNTERSEFDSGFSEFLDDISFSLSGLYESPPIGRNLSRITLGVTRDRNDIVRGNFQEEGFRSETERYTLAYRYPILRKVYNEFNLEFGFVREESQTFVDRTTPFPIGIGPDDSGISRTSTFFFGQEYIQRGDKNLFLLRSQFNLGTRLFDATNNSSSIPDSEFFSWVGQAQWLKPLSENHRLFARGIIQLTPNSLLPVNQFVVGGNNSVRGYRQNFRSGDNGLILAIEDRIRVFIDGEKDWLDLQVIPFFDAGWVWNNGNNPNQIPDPNFIASLGLGLQADLLEDKNLRVRLDYGIPLSSGTEIDSDFRDQRFHFSVGYHHIFR